MIASKPSIVASRGVGYELFMEGEVYVLVVGARPIERVAVEEFAAVRHEMESLFPGGFGALLDFRDCTTLPSLEARTTLATRARLADHSRLLARAIVLPDDPVHARLVHAFLVATTRSAGVRCPELYVERLDEAVAFLSTHVPTIASVTTFERRIGTARARIVSDAARSPRRRSRAR